MKSWEYKIQKQNKLGQKILIDVLFGNSQLLIGIKINEEKFKNFIPFDPLG